MPAALKRGKRSRGAQCKMQQEQNGDKNLGVVRCCLALCFSTNQIIRTPGELANPQFLPAHIRLQTRVRYFLILTLLDCNESCCDTDNRCNRSRRCERVCPV
jgi:hypothetical protein